VLPRTRTAPPPSWRPGYGQRPATHSGARTLRPTHSASAVEPFQFAEAAFRKEVSELGEFRAVQRGLERSRAVS
jgi:hypothetical protein